METQLQAATQRIERSHSEPEAPPRAGDQGSAVEDRGGDDAAGARQSRVGESTARRYRRSARVIVRPFARQPSDDRQATLRRRCERQRARGDASRVRQGEAGRILPTVRLSYGWLELVNFAG